MVFLTAFSVTSPTMPRAWRPAPTTSYSSLTSLIFPVVSARAWKLILGLVKENDERSEI